MKLAGPVPCISAYFGPPGRGAHEISRAWGIYLRHIIGHREGAHMKLAGPGPFTRHLMENVFLPNDMFYFELELISAVSNPKGGNQAPSIRIRGRHIFDVFSTSYGKRFSAKMMS